ncbi:MAG: hypothetical protein AB1545_14395 [Thermodesulfobacteriota bacterium]
MDNKSSPKTAEVPKKQKLGIVATALIALAVSFATAVGVVAFYDQRYAQKIVTLDLQGYIRAQRDKAVAGEISDEELRKNIDAMESVLLAQPPNHIVLLKEVVLRNAREIKP